jgi:hypothetical protein
MKGMNMKKYDRLILLILLPCILWGLEDFIPPRSTGFVSIGGQYQQWNSDDFSDPIQQTSGPILVFYPVTPNWFLNISNSPASASTGDLSISGVSDTWIRTTYVTPNEQFMINFGIGVPTGRSDLTMEELALVSSLSQNIFRFRLPVYGQGLNIRAGFGVAIPMQQGSVIGLGANYIVKGAYTFLDGLATEYDPGDEINVVAGLGVPVGNGKWSIDAVYTLYSVDRVDGTDIIDAGDKILVNTSLAYKSNSSFFYGALRFRQRGKNELYIPTGMETIGDQIETDGLWQFRQWAQGGLSVIWDGRFYSENEAGFGHATIYGAGIGLQHGLNPKTSVRAQIKYLTGTIQYITDINVSGLDLLIQFIFKI